MLGCSNLRASRVAQSESRDQSRSVQARARQAALGRVERDIRVRLTSLTASADRLLVHAIPLRKIPGPTAPLCAFHVRDEKDHCRSCTPWTPCAITGDLLEQGSIFGPGFDSLTVRPNEENLSAA